MSDELDLVDIESRLATLEEWKRIREEQILQLENDMVTAIRKIYDEFDKRDLEIKGIAKKINWQSGVYAAIGGAIPIAITIIIFLLSRCN